MRDEGRKTLPLLVRQLSCSCSKRCKCSAQLCVKAKGLIHFFITGGTADGQTCNAVLPAPVLCRLCQFSGNSFSAEYRLDIKVVKHARIGTGKGRKTFCHTAHSHSPIAAFCHIKCERVFIVLKKWGKCKPYSVTV